MASEDITFCMNQNCNYMKCFRNPKHIKQHWMMHSFMKLEGTEDCPKKKKGEHNGRNNQNGRINQT